MGRPLDICGRIAALLACAALLSACQPQAEEESFYFGVDLSYVNEMQDCGATYLEDGKPQDPFQLFHDHGANLVRARLWHSPDWTDYSTLEDVRKTFIRARDAGMQTLLDIHYSDEWADPSKQFIPAAWEDISDDEELADAVYQYTTDVLAELANAKLTPAFVQIGNETNPGILMRGTKQDWSHDALMFNAGIRAVRDINKKLNTSTRIVIHVAQPENTSWWFAQAAENGITDFDVIGVSYYPQWSEFSIGDMGAQATVLRQTYGKDVMVVETGYPWTYDAAPESASNVLTEGERGYPATPEGQRQFMTDLTQTLINNGALGVVYWEPAWVSTTCSTRWGQGSHWENVTFFDFKNGNEVLEGIDFLNASYSTPTTLVDGVVEDAYGKALLEDASGDNLGGSAVLDLSGLHVRDDGGPILLGITVAGDVFSEAGQSYLIYFDTTGDGQGANVDVGKRPITVADPFGPEYRLDIRIADQKGTIGSSYTLSMWDGSEWQEITFSGGAAIHSGSPSVIELLIPKSLLGNPAFLNIGVVSTDRARIHTASDILGSDVSPSAWEEPAVLDTFARFEIKEPNP